jgi:hypothetical protein
MAGRLPPLLVGGGLEFQTLPDLPSIVVNAYSDLTRISRFLDRTPIGKSDSGNLPLSDDGLDGAAGTYKL